MPSNQSKYYSYQQASLSQKVSFKIPILRELVGSDQELGDSIAVLSYIGNPENLKKTPIKFTLGLLDVLRLSHFVNNEKTDILSKLGFLFPKEDEEEDWSEDEG